MAITAMAQTISDTAGSTAHYGITNVKTFDYSSTDTSLTTKVYHGVSIVSSNGIVGRIQSWQPDAYTREGVHLYELSHVHFGRPVEYVPGKTTGFTIAVARAEVWGAEMELAFGSTMDLYEDLTDQNMPFMVQEFWFQGSNGKQNQVWTYQGCWFQNKNMDAITSDGDGITRISATLAYVSRQKLAAPN